ncbi:DUF5004 domain-containing protein [Pontibacter korlensis]|uniref:Lipocalin-like domain-containing protein n=1 Tax=Pontibacter korlensis TaxID=400092 RepID=A0A0E3UVA9_9BACT|nr:DUF5004 domain-containing protein [Pontibacter korlensis]AKD02367.1 hypothetical protein PKOR_03545 [Pontibacter korlensis]
MRSLFTTIAIFILCSFSSFAPKEQQTAYSIVGSWRLVDMQIGDDKEAKEKSDIENTLHQSTMRLVFEESGQFRMELDTDGRGLSGGYYYDAESQVLSIRYGTHIDTALVTWDGKDRMIHATQDGTTTTTMERVTE